MNKKQLILGLFAISASTLFSGDQGDSSLRDRFSNGVEHVWENKKKYVVGGGALVLCFATRGRIARLWRSHGWVTNEVVVKNFKKSFKKLDTIDLNVVELRKSSVLGKKEVLDLISKNRELSLKDKQEIIDEASRLIMDSEARQISFLNGKFEGLESRVMERLDRLESNGAAQSTDALSAIKDVLSAIKNRKDKV